MAEQSRMVVQPAGPAAPFNPVLSIKAILDAERAPPPDPATPAPSPEPELAEAPQPETPEGDPAPQEPEAPAEPNQQPEGSEPAADEIPLERLEAIELEVSVKGEDGKDVVQKLPVKELKQGYMRQADYSRKTAEVARQREAIPEEIRKGVEGERAAYYQTLQTLQETVIGTMDPELKTADWTALSRDDPATYVRLDNRRKEIDRVLSEIQSKQREIIDQRKAERAKARNQQAIQSLEVLEGKIPGWGDAHYQKLMKAAVEHYGYKPDEVADWVDHKAFEVLHDAYQFRQLKAKAPEAPLVGKKVVVPPKVVRPGAAAPATAAQQRQTKAMEKLQKSGTVQDAAAVIKSRMG